MPEITTRLYLYCTDEELYYPQRKGCDASELNIVNTYCLSAHQLLEVTGDVHSDDSIGRDYPAYIHFVAQAMVDVTPNSPTDSTPNNSKEGSK